MSVYRMSIAFAVCLLTFPLALCQSGSPSDIRLPPTILIGPSKGDYYRSEYSFTNYRSEYSFTLNCKAHGVPEVSYEWKRNGVDLNLNGFNVKREADGTIIIDPATSLDAGFYQCIAKNQFGTALSNTSYMRRAYLDSKGSTQVATKIVTEGEPFCIEAHPTKSDPDPKSTWEMAMDPVDKNPNPIALSKRMQIAENGDLCFAYAKAEDDLGGKIYKIAEFNEVLDLTAGGSFTKVTVNRVPGGPKEFAPTLSFSSPTETVAVEGSDVTLRCFFSGNPEPNIVWTGPKNTLPAGRYEISSQQTTLTIRKLQSSDEGDYICSSGNSKGRNQHIMQIRVEALPRFMSFDDQPHDTNVTQDTSITFKCNTYAKPKAKVEWLRNGQALKPDNLPKRFAFSSNRKSLTIIDVCRNCDDREDQTDLMVIQCNASNVHGYAFASGYLNVLTKTKVILVNGEDVYVRMDEEREVKFECSATSDPSTPPSVRWYKVENNEEQPVREEPPTVTIKDGTLTFYVNPNGTQKWTKYHGEYRCIGDNRYSTDKAAVSLKAEEYIPPAGKETTNWQAILIVVFLCLLVGTIGIIIGWCGKRYCAAKKGRSIAKNDAILHSNLIYKGPVHHANSIDEDKRYDSVELEDVRTPVEICQSEEANLYSELNSDPGPTPVYTALRASDYRNIEK